MKILIVCSLNSGRIVPFIVEQAESLIQAGIEVEYFTVQGKGITGYLRNYKSLRKQINKYKPDIIHAHYGLSGLLANLQRRVPVVTTYHGSDINSPKVYPISRLCMMLSAYNIFVSEKNKQKAGLKKKQSLIPCGVNIELFVPMDQNEAALQMGLDTNKKNVLFAGAFNNAVKNGVLAQEAAALITDIHLIELKGYTREQVVWLMNAVDAVLMTSHTEGSPQFIKESMACNCPIVSVPVGDVPEVINGIEGCTISTYEPTDVADKLKQALVFGKRTEGRKRIIEMGLDSETVAKKIIAAYNTVINGY